MRNYKMTKEIREEISKKYPHELYEGEPEVAIPKCLEENGFSPNKYDTVRHGGIICVGDVVSKYVMSSPYRHHVKFCFVDGKTQRTKETPIPDDERDGFDFEIVNNKNGTISGDAIDLIASHDMFPCIVNVKGEEDLLVIPCSIFHPDCLIIYGQPPITDDNIVDIPSGCVAVYGKRSSEENLELLDRFEFDNTIYDSSITIYPELYKMMKMIFENTGISVSTQIELYLKGYRIKKE